MTSLKFARWAALAGAGLMMSSVGAAAQEGMFMKDMLGTIGILPKERPSIEYRERAPLVLPPKMELREPKGRNSVKAANPQWPNDPEVVAERRREAEARIPVTETERRRLEQNPTLSVEEIRKGRRPGAEIPSSPVYRPGDSSRHGYWVSPDELTAKKSKNDEVAMDVGVEPTRRDLTEPPAGFRKATAPLKRDFEPIRREDEADPKVYNREQAARR